MGKMTVNHNPDHQITLNPSRVSKMIPNTVSTGAKLPRIGRGVAQISKSTCVGLENKHSIEVNARVESSSLHAHAT